MKRTLSALIAGVALASLFGGTAFADGSIRIDQVWARATAGLAKTGALYITVTNTGAAPDRLMAISTPAADMAELHETKMNNGVMEMRPIGPVTIEPGKTVTLAPGADHIMLTGLKAPLKVGDKVPVTLTFEHAGAMPATASVEKAGAMSAGDSGGMSDMPGMPGMKMH